MGAEPRSGANAPAACTPAARLFARPFAFLVPLLWAARAGGLCAVVHAPVRLGAPPCSAFICARLQRVQISARIWLHPCDTARLSAPVRLSAPPHAQIALPGAPGARCGHGRWNCLEITRLGAGAGNLPRAPVCVCALWAPVRLRPTERFYAPSRMFRAAARFRLRGSAGPRASARSLLLRRATTHDARCGVPLRACALSALNYGIRASAAPVRTSACQHTWAAMRTPARPAHPSRCCAVLRPSDRFFVPLLLRASLRLRASAAARA